MDNLPTLSETLRIHNIRANKKLGQHFLLDMNITHKIAELALPLDHVSVAEIGPGPGGLTRALLQAGAQTLCAIEKDENFLPPLSDLAHQAPHLEIRHADALTFDIATHLSAPIKIVSNLPYNVGTKLLVNWLMARPIFWEQAVLMFQKEVAERIIAQTGDKAYGRLAVLAQSLCDCHMALKVPAQAFTPPPKVDSAVIVLTPKPASLRYLDPGILGTITAAAFGQRRKMLRKSLASLAKTHGIEVLDWLSQCEIEATRRAETLSLEEFHRLANFIRRQ